VLVSSREVTRRVILAVSQVVVAERGRRREQRVTDRPEAHSPNSEAIAAHYASGYEADRLHQGVGQLDRERSRELLGRFLPPAPARSSTSEVGRAVTPAGWPPGAIRFT
jgi:hypothetical protein